MKVVTVKPTTKRHMVDELTKSVAMFQTKARKIVKFYFAVEGTPNDYFVPKFFDGPAHIVPPTPLATPIACGEMEETPTRPQKSVVAATLRQINSIGGATIIAGCGTGKTMVAIKIACELGLKTGVLIHNNFLIEQWRERIESFCEKVKVGVVRQNVCEDGDFILMSMKSIVSRNYELPELGLLIVDEVHHVPAKNFVQALMKIKATYTLGLTATPKRKDGLESIIYDTLGPVSYLVKPTPDPNVQVNIISYDGYLPMLPFNRLSHTIGFMIKDHARNTLLVRLIMLMKVDRPMGKGLLLSDRVAHLQTLHAMIPSGVSEIVCGAINTTEGGKVTFDQFLTLSTYGLLSEAVDCDADFIIFGTPKSSVEQSTGRIMRGRSVRRPIIIDLRDMRNSVLVKMADKRSAFYKSRKYQEVHVKANELN